MKPPTVLWFRRDGSVRGLYTEVISLTVLGRLQIERASTVEFNPVLQVWEIMDCDGRRLHASSSRRDCLDWEREHFSQTEPNG